jgi:transposase
VSSAQSKRSALQQVRAWNPDPEQVKVDRFAADPFFDPEDRAQVKYEMLRQREVDGAALEVSCREFGFTRESYRHLLERFRCEGMGGLFERKRGRKNPLKANDEVRRWLRHEHARDPSLGPEELARRCDEQTGVQVSRRTVYRVLADVGAEKKKRRSKAKPRPPRG